MQHLIYSTINLGLILGIIGYLLRKPLGEFMSSRHHSTVKDIADVRDLARRAEEKFQDYSAKLKAIDVEVQSILNQAQRETAEIKKKIVENAEKISKTLIKDAGSSLDAMLVEVKAQIRREFAETLVARLEKQLSSSLTGEDRSRIQKEFSTQLQAVRA
jgi:F0F1-type ATP synthase membrane subunit b/b'